jgi:glutathione S-transferase
MSKLILHSYRRCPFAIRVRMVLEEKGAIYSVIEESLRAPSAELLRMHPEGKVPLLRHDGRVVYESAIITEYLDEVLSGPKLTPTTATSRAEMRLWTYWIHTIFKNDLDEFKYRKPTLELA